MLFSKTFVALAATFLTGALAAPVAEAAPTNLKIRNIEARDVIEDSYIVVYKADISTADLDAAVASANGMLTKRAAGGKGPKKHKGVGNKFNMDGFKGYQIEADEATIAEISAQETVSRFLPFSSCLRLDTLELPETSWHRIGVSTPTSQSRIVTKQSRNNKLIFQTGRLRREG